MTDCAFKYIKHAEDAALKKSIIINSGFKVCFYLKEKDKYFAQQL